MKRVYLAAILVISTTIGDSNVSAKPPAAIPSIATIDDLKAAADAQIAVLDEILANKPGYEEARKKKIPQAAGLLACLAQSIAEHTGNSTLSVAGPDLRDAALAVIAAAKHDDAAAALAKAHEALAGKSDGKSAVEHPWNKLIRLGRLMEEVEGRTGKIRSALRQKLKDPNAARVHATSLAVLSLPLQADTHEVKDPKDLPQWQTFVAEFRRNTVDLSAAVKNKDADAALKSLAETRKRCAECHKVFRHE